MKHLAIAQLILCFSLGLALAFFTEDRFEALKLGALGILFLCTPLIYLSYKIGEYEVDETPSTGSNQEE